MRLLHEPEMNMRPVLGKIKRRPTGPPFYNLIITPPINVRRGDRENGKLPKH